ncbi:hypothetical protein C8J56DRAFT_1138249 [Mycena floridula]|nr:hypothetical protein C8J56DRAFT_1138249 [Mycena floridula]
MYFTAFDIVHDPKKILHAGAPHLPVDAFTGAYGAVVNDGHHVVTTPNAISIYEPPLSQRKVRMRADGRFGEDDYTIWPQPFFKPLSYLAVMPRRPWDPNDPLHLFWHTPSHHNFRRDYSQSGIGLGIFNPSYIARYRPFIDELFGRYEAYHSGHQQPNQLAMSLALSLKQCLERLENLSMSFRRSLIQLTQLQRTYLELVGVLDWVQKFQPMLQGLIPVPAPLKVAETMGAFVYDDQVAQSFFRVGLPFWRVHSVTKLAHIRIDQLHDVYSPSNAPATFVTQDDATPPFPVIFMGSATDPEKNQAIERFLNTLMKDKDPFSEWKSYRVLPDPPDERRASVPSTSSTVPIPPSSRRRAQNNHSKSSYHTKPSKGKQSKQGNVQQQRDPFAELVSPCSPLTADIWVSAVEQIDRSRLPPAGSGIGHIFPHPALFLGVQSPEKRRNFVRNWLLFRQAFIAHVASNQYSVVNSETWRRVLGLRHGPSAELEQGQQRTARDFVKACFDEAGLDFDFSSNEHSFTWRGQADYLVDLESDEMVKEIMWELFEMGFRQEFFALDRQASLNTSRPSLDFDVIRRCLATDTSTPLLSVSFDRASEGLAANARRDRGIYMIQLLRRMLEWSGGIDALVNYAEIDEPEKMTIEAEEAIVVFYVQSFFDHFGRPPTIPHRPRTTIKAVVPTSSLSRIPSICLFYDLLNSLTLTFTMNFKRGLSTRWAAAVIEWRLRCFNELPFSGVDNIAVEFTVPTNDAAVAWAFSDHAVELRQLRAHINPQWLLARLAQATSSAQSPVFISVDPHVNPPYDSDSDPEMPPLIDIDESDSGYDSD